MQRIVGTKSEFLKWGFSLDDCPEFSKIPKKGILLYYDDGYWYFQNSANHPLSEPDNFITPQTWLQYVTVPTDRIEQR